MDLISYRNKRGETFGVVDDTAFLAPVGTDVSSGVSLGLLQRVKATLYRCQELYEARLHEDAARSVTLVVKNGVRPTDVSTLHVETDDEAVQRDFVAAVVGKMRPTQQSRMSSLRTELFGPLIVGALVAVAGAVIISIAFDIAGETFHAPDRVGSARTHARLFETIARTLGITGSIAVFGILLLLCLVWLLNVVRGKHMVIRWRLVS
jgi:hypothetical protein